MPIPGSRTPAHIAENLAAARITLSADDLARIDAALKGTTFEGTAAVVD
ncbi:hypothetical protein JCM4914_50660 [Streptomyces platensis subsp. malvinus]